MYGRYILSRSFYDLQIKSKLRGNDEVSFLAPIRVTLRLLHSKKKLKSGNKTAGKFCSLLKNHYFPFFCRNGTAILVL